MGIWLILIGLILLWKGIFWKNNYETSDSDKVRLLIAGIGFVVIGLLEVFQS